MRGRVGEQLELCVGARQFFHFAGKFLLRSFLLGDVAYECGKETLFTPAYGGDSQFYGEFGSVPVQRCDFNSLVQHRTLSGGKKAPKTLRMSFTIAVRNSHLGEGLSDGLRTGPSEGGLRLGIPICNQTV